MAPSLTEFQFDTLTEGGPLFLLALQHLQTLYPGDYSRESTSTIGPLGPDYEFDMELEAGMHIY